MQSAGRGGRQPPRLGERVNPGCKQGFVSVDVAQARKHLLVEQPAFKRAVPSAHGLKKLLLSNLGRVRTESREDFRQLLFSRAAQVAEAASVAITNLLAAVFENQSHVSVKLKTGFAPR